MAVFEYRARDGAGQVQTGLLTADSPAEGRRRLRAGGLRIERFNPAAARKRRSAEHSAGSARWLQFSPTPRRTERVAEFARHLALLLRTGVPLAEALDVLIAQSGGRRWAAVLRDVRERIAAGASLHEALQVYPQWFDALTLSAVRVGQQAGALDTALGQLAGFLKERHVLRNRLTAALTYPLVVLTLGLGVTLFLMTHVLPQLLSVLRASGRPLPLATRVLKQVSDLLVGHWPGLVLGLAIAVALICAVLRSRRGRYTAQRLGLRLPLIGSLWRKTLVARFAQQMSMLLASGVPFTEALAVVRRGGGNLVLGGELERMARAVEAGSDLAPTLRASRVFPPLVVHLVAVGQSTGELTAMLAELRSGYDTEVQFAVTRLAAVLEPLLIVVLAGVIGAIIFATLLPILELTRTIQ